MADFMKPSGESEGVRGHWRIVIVLMLIYMYAFIDRMILSLLVDPVRDSLGASDIQMSLLLGVAFATLFCACNVPAGYFADRINRRAMLGIASVIWALMTVICGFSSSYWQLFLARAGVGIAEGVIGPTAFSMIRDAVPSKSRALAFSIYGMAPMIGSAISLSGGAYLLKAAGQGAFIGAPVLGSLEPWQVTLVLVGLCGLPLSLLLLSFREPPRISKAPPSDETILGSLATAWHYISENRRIYTPLLIFAAFGAMMSFAKNAWFPTAFSRHWNMAPEDVGPILGAMTLIGGILGLLFGGWVMNRAIARGRTAMEYGIVGVVGTALGTALAFTAPSLAISYIGIQIAQFFIGVSFAAGATTLGEVTPVSMMGRVGAVYLIVQTLAGQSLGPFVVAAVSETFFGGPTGIPIALTTTMIGLGLVCTAAATAIILQHARSSTTAATA